MFKIVDGKQIKLSTKEIAELESMRKIAMKGINAAITVPKISFEKELNNRELLDNLDELLDTYPDRMLKRWYNSIVDISLNNESTQEILKGIGLTETQSLEVFTAARSAQL